MSDETKTNLPSQKELEKELSDYLSRKYGERVKILSTGLYPQPDKEKDSEGDKVVKDRPVFNFRITPEELVEYLDEYVVQQDDAKAVLATKICTHFNRIRYFLERPEQGRRNVGQIKSNVLLIGPTGVGKTYLIKLIAQKLGVPFVKGDATKFSETGYVGGDVEDLVRDLVRQADGDIERAQCGIIYVDEIDKIAASQYRLGADVSRSGVQRAFLKPMEETEVELKVPHDPISQIEAMEHYRATGKREKRVVNTKNILFVMSGSFGGLEEIIRRRVQQLSMGFEGTVSSKKESRRFLKMVKAEDLIESGFESEFIGRLPVVTVLNELTVADMFQILTNPNSSVVVGKKQDFQAYGIHLIFEEEALAEIARLAVGEQTGARGLVSVTEKVLLPFEKKLPSTELKYLVVTIAMVHDPKAELALLLEHPEQVAWHEKRYAELAMGERLQLEEFIRHSMARKAAAHHVSLTDVRVAMIAEQCQRENLDPHELCETFMKYIDHIGDCAEFIASGSGMRVRFTEAAVDRILAKTPRGLDTINKTCEEIATAFEYGLQLLSQKKGVDHVEIPPEGVDNPSKFMNELVAKIFHN